MKESFKKYWTYYLAFIFFILGMFYYSKAYGHDHFAYDSEGNIYYFQHPLAIKHMDMYLEYGYVYGDEVSDVHDFRALALGNCKTNAQKAQFYLENGERCYLDAKERCWWLPNISYREKARYCFTTIGVLVVPGADNVKLIIALVNLLIQYGLDCSNEWHYINNKLYWSQYHFEMMAFHLHLMENGYP